MRLSWSLLAAALASPVMAAESGPFSDATYQMTLTCEGRQCPSTWIFKDGQVVLPQAAPYALAKDSTGILVTWQTQEVAGSGGDDAGFEMKILDLASSSDGSGSGAMMASASAGVPSGQTVTTTYHAHLAADGTLSGSADCFMGRISGGTMSFSGKRSGPARPLRKDLNGWYRMTRSANDSLLEMGLVDLDFVGSGGNSLGSGSMKLDGEGNSTSSSGDLVMTYADGTTTLACGPAQAVFTDRGRTLTIRGTTFTLGAEHLTIAVPVQGAPTVAAHHPLPAPLVLDGRSFHVQLHAADGTADDHMNFTGGRLDMTTCSTLGVWPTYTVEQRADGTHLLVHQDSGESYHHLCIDITGVVAGGHLTGQGQVSRAGTTLMSFDIAGDEQGSAKDKK